MMLLAKSPSRDGSSKGLLDHSRDVMDAFASLFGNAQAPSRLAEIWLRFFRLPMSQFALFYCNAMAACGLHDLGKATDSFQEAVTKHRAQSIRHEHMSALILTLPQVADWLNTKLDTDLVISAVAGHHLKSSDQASRDYPEFGAPWMGYSDIVELFVESPDVEAVFDITAERSGLESADLDLPPIWSFSGNIGQSIPDTVEQLRQRFNTVQLSFRKNTGRQALFMAVKSAVVAADGAGSGLPREGLGIASWLPPLFSSAELLTDEIISPKSLTNVFFK